jgi:UDP-3-O-[3-hydroxymyristoyl] glucosamine N-acyltransferase
LLGVASLYAATSTDLSFCTGGRWQGLLPSTAAGAVILHNGDVPGGTVALRHKQPRAAYAVAAAALMPLDWPTPGVHPTAVVHPSVDTTGCTIDPYAVVSEGVELGSGTWLQAHVFVGANSILGSDCRVMPHAVLMEGCTLGDRVWLQPGAVVGSDGFGHVIGPKGPIRVPQVGGVVIGDDVEVGANACVDRAALGETTLGAGCRLDNLVQVAHGVQMGEACMLAAFSGVAGGSRLGNGVIMAGRSAVVDGIVVGDGTVFAGLASASKDVPAGRRLGGSPARNYQQWLREVAALRALPAALRELARLVRRVGTLEDEGK